MHQLTIKDRFIYLFRRKKVMLSEGEMNTIMNGLSCSVVRYPRNSPEYFLAMELLVDLRDKHYKMWKKYK